MRRAMSSMLAVVALAPLDLADRLDLGGPPRPARLDGVRTRPDGRHPTPAAATILHWLLPRPVEEAHGR